MAFKPYLIYAFHQDAVYNQLAELGRQAGEVGAEAGHAHDQVGVFARVFVRFEHFLGVHDVQVDLRAAQLEVGADQVATRSTPSSSLVISGSSSICMGAVLP